MYNRVGVIGDRNSVLAFRAVGIEVYNADTAEEARELIRKLSREDFAVLFITEILAEKIEDVLIKAKSNPFPAIVPIPTASGSSGFGLKNVKKD
ncbi:MAG: V-type ATP synthase subunit F, partial [Clostridia bacterium]